MTRTQQAAAAVVLATASVFPALAQTRALDGRSFQGVFIEKGKTSGDADTLVFRDGKFRSSACDRYGYSEAPYKAASAGDMTRFEAETYSPKYGKLRWNGVIAGGKLDATAVMVRDGKPDIENWVVAGEKN